MSVTPFLPRILVIDDLFGRSVCTGRNEERSNLCGQYLLVDVTGDERAAQQQRIKEPLASVVFCRGQRPSRAVVGDVVENDLNQIIDVVSSGWPPPGPQGTFWSLVLLDLSFITGTVTAMSDRQTPGMPLGRSTDKDPKTYFGLTVLEELRDRFPELPVIILSSQPRAGVSREFSAGGALGFLERDSEDSPSLLADYITRHALVPDVGSELVGYSLGLLKVLRQGRRITRTRSNVLIRAERGSGKELLARYVHRLSPKGRLAPFVVLDSGTLSPELYASTLFGHKRGAFTGADRDKVGAIEQADDGDLFLDEIGNMPISVQTGILRVIESRVVQPIGSGSNDVKAVNVRFISATNADIEAVAAAGHFREDLYDRLREGGVLFLPPLRERLEDLPCLVEHFVRMAETRNAGALRRYVEPETLAHLRSYSWPGNLRELRSRIFQAITEHPDVEHLLPSHFSLPTRPSRALEDAERKPSIRDVGTLLDSIQVERAASLELAGHLPHLERAWARVLAEYLRACLLATARPSVEYPAGEILVQPAVRLMTGDGTLKAYQAYDVIKRVLGIAPAHIQDLLSTPPLREVYEKAIQSRKNTKRS